MHIDPVGAAHQAAHAHEAGPPVDKPGNGNKAGQLGAAETEVEASGLTDAPSKGVLRLLEAGYFKGVADVRLRINFQEELGALSSARQSAAASTGIPDVEVAVTASVSILIEAEGVTEDQSTAIQNALSAFVEALGNAGSGEENPIDALQTAFDTFIEEVRSVLELDVEPIPPAEGEEPPPPSPFVALVQNIEAAFNDALSTLQDSLESAGSLTTEFTEPNGNGVAFQKFLSILQGLQETEPVPATTETTETTETEPVIPVISTEPEINSIDQNI